MKNCKILYFTQLKRGRTYFIREGRWLAFIKPMILIIILIGLNMRTNYLDFSLLHVIYHKSSIKNIYILLLSANQIRLHWLLIGVRLYQF